MSNHDTNRAWQRKAREVMRETGWKYTEAFRYVKMNVEKNAWCIDCNNSWLECVCRQNPDYFGDFK